MKARRCVGTGLLLFAALALAPVPPRAGPQSDPRIERGAPRVAGMRLDQRSTLEVLKSYDGLWMNPDLVALRAVEEELLRRLDRLPPQELVALLRHGVGTRAANLVLITLENARRGPRWSEYENALVLGMERVFEQPDKLAVLSDVVLRFSPSPENAEVAARLLMKRGPSGRLADDLGGFGARLEGPTRGEIKQFAVKHDLIETLGHLVDDASDVVRLQRYFGDPATRARAERALETATRSVRSEELQRQIRGALGEAAGS